MFFRTERLEIRRLEQSDFQAFHEMQGNINVMRYIIGRAKMEEENMQEFNRIIKSYEQENTDLLVMAVTEVKDKARLLGTCALVKNDYGKNEIGYRILERFWGRGYGHEVLEGLIEFALAEKGIKEVVAIADVENIPSIKILEKSSMEFIEEMKEEESNNIVKVYKKYK
ncbi:GNAT family N-acetyltransferase [Bacillus haimaensis]|uniref:GNAT family N-acetyltransferase n=1 Tax=Bacillus haimaensis TaxID=3160967 RepID=UPI003AA916F7